MQGVECGGGDAGLCSMRGRKGTRMPAARAADREYGVDEDLQTRAQISAGAWRVIGRMGAFCTSRWAGGARCAHTMAYFIEGDAFGSRVRGLSRCETRFNLKGARW